MSWKLSRRVRSVKRAKTDQSPRFEMELACADGILQFHHDTFFAVLRVLRAVTPVGFCSRLPDLRKGRAVVEPQRRLSTRSLNHGFNRLFVRMVVPVAIAAEKPVSGIDEFQKLRRDVVPASMMG